MELFPVAVWVGIVMFAVFKIIDQTIGLRVTSREEIEGPGQYRAWACQCLRRLPSCCAMEDLGSRVESVAGIHMVRQDVPVEEAIPVKSADFFPNR